MQFTIRQARTFAGISQESMAKRLGIDRGTYRKIEKNPDLATVGVLRSISNATGIPVHEIFLGCNSTFVDNLNVRDAAAGDGAG